MVRKYILKKMKVALLLTRYVPIPFLYPLKMSENLNVFTKYKNDSKKESYERFLEL